jgi:hypothetical protein
MLMGSADGHRFRHLLRQTAIASAEELLEILWQKRLEKSYCARGMVAIGGLRQ